MFQKMIAVYSNPILQLQNKIPQCFKASNLLTFLVVTTENQTDLNVGKIKKEER